MQVVFECCIKSDLILKVARVLRGLHIARLEVTLVFFLDNPYIEPIELAANIIEEVAAAKSFDLVLNVQIHYWL